MPRDNGHGATCAYCKRMLVGAPSRSALMATRDHEEPKCRGGLRTVWACFTCNTMKGNMTLAEWLAFTRETPEWWKTGPKPFSRGRSRPPVYTPRPDLDFFAPPEAVRALARRIVEAEG